MGRPLALGAAAFGRAAQPPRPDPTSTDAGTWAAVPRRGALRELLHDGHEGFLSFDPISPVKPHLGAEFEELAGRLQAAIEVRYGLPGWHGDDHVLHKRADRLAAASEAVHVAGWSRRDLHETLNIDLTPVLQDPLPRPEGMQPCEPWPAKLAASLFLYKLRELTAHEWRTEEPAALEAALEREQTLAQLAVAFSRLSPGKRRRCRPLTGNSLTDTYVYATAHDCSQHVEGVVVDGEQDGDGHWLLDQDFTIFTADEELIVCHGHNCDVELG